MTKIVLAADHRGFKLKEDLKMFLEAQGHIVEDVGAHTLDPNDDYPDFAYPGSLIIAAEPDAKGIFICGSGMGMDVVANKVKGVRSTVAYSKDSAIHAASSDGVNVITLAADVLDGDAARDIVQAFLATPFSGEERHVRRLRKIGTIEDEHMR